MSLQPRPDPYSHAHQHSNIHAGLLPPLNKFHRYLTDGGWLEMGAEVDRIKFARAGHFVYVPRAGSVNYASHMRLALLQTAIAENWLIRLEPPERLRR